MTGTTEVKMTENNCNELTKDFGYIPPIILFNNCM